ncbi:glycosyltransferase [Aeromicrobium sp. 636]|uniref:Glycosyltransferase family 2 protein n=1 Tax=Aeromicrobium senzhongii TaxID=2663859 RepID=A0A8I0EVY3_9ACTN|nr:MULTISPECIES: glycosyltransferase family 2 protein [Aeromicrobium]MBC9226348.1 glycosyltransferase family 2 protein [Aeromicrobium senzhongii]MCQ3998453.1 glycosyltransferase [Aeromicrobium sp. 636]
MSPDAPRAPLVSVVIPTHNNESTVAEAIESVLTQEDVLLELIVSDHASTDRTLELARAFEADPRVSVVSAPAGGGAPSNWNHVSAHAQAPLIKLLCGDDALLPGTLARQARLMDDGQVALVACRRHVIDTRGRVLVRGRGLRRLAGRLPGSEAIRVAVRSGTNPFGEPACVMMRREALEAAGGWWGERPYVIDLATYFRVLERGDFVADDHTGAVFRLSTTQQSAWMTRVAAREVGELLRWATARTPVITRADLLLGVVRSRVLGAARALVYVAMRHRSRRSGA